jgi:TonB family protein
MFQAGDKDGARKAFERTLAMLDDSAIDEGDDLADLRLVASGFLDLTKIEAQPESGPEPAPVAAQPAEAPPDRQAAKITTLPVTIRQALPPWRPDSTTSNRAFSGAVRIVIDATGRVTSASMERPVYPSYDRLVLEAARDWLYKPATLDGEPVPSEKTVEIELRP